MKIKFFRTLLFMMIVLSSGFALGQTVSGTVTSDGVPLPGATIVVKGTTNGTSTDFDGLYTLNEVPSDAVLVFSYIGYVTQEVAVNGRTEINVVMDQDAKALDEVVVIGYGTQKRSELTYAVSTVKADQISEIPAADIAQTLQGRAAGITVINGGSPGERTAIRIRGLSTFGSGDPLYVVDGVFTNNINSINPGSIEKVDVLKDAASTAIYGSRGANGVIIITTSKGTRGKANFKFSTYAGFQQSNKRYDVLNTEQYIQYIREVNAQSFIPGAGGAPIPRINDDPNFDGNGIDTDWQDEFFRSAPITNYDFNVSGGSEIGRYNFGFSAFDQDGIYVDTNFKRQTFNINSEANVTDKFRVGETFSLGFSQRIAPQVAGGREPLFNLLASAPYVPVRNPDGTFAGAQDGDNNNARNQLRVQDSDDNLNRFTSLIGSLYAEYDLPYGFKFRSQYGLDAFFSFQDNIQRAFSVGEFSRDITSINKGRASQISRIFTNSLSFNKTFAEVHNFEATLVSERQDTRFETLTGSSTNELTSAINELVGTGGTNSRTEDNILISYLGRVNYNYDGKYLASAAIRRDKSSRFGPNNQVGWFPSASVGWVASKESFLADSEVINNLKFRASYGVTGNNRIPFDVANANVAFDLIYPVGGVTSLASAVNGIANPDVQWEEATKQNFGVDVGLWNNKVTFTGEYFINSSDGLLVNETARASAGGGGGNQGLGIIRNAGDIEVTGFEFTVGYNDYEGDFKWSASANFTTTESTVNSLGQQDQLLQARINPLEASVSRLAPGQPLYHFFGRIFEGVYSTEQEIIDDLGADNLDPTSGATYQPRPGDARFRDINGDGDITDEDRTIIGDPNPDFTYAVNLNASYKGFDFSALITGVQGADAFNTNVFSLEGQERVNNAGVEVLRRWQNPGDITDVPRFRFGRNDNNQISTRFIEDASYARLKNVTLGYSLPADLLDRVFNGTISKVRLYVQSQNLVTLTNYSGLDPEIEPFYGAAGIIEGLNIDRGRGPQPKTFLTGLQIEF
ncbi:SusC/RagA family TonB-linked outer membrane protein [Spongiimicrobium salis]|uniref:SusC/RagA family TonB-linked outer membrane protein n=1 Tax=Spongiimicrobium salis TaxID=1667022 RepID=UPI00374CBE73